MGTLGGAPWTSAEFARCSTVGIKLHRGDHLRGGFMFVFAGPRLQTFFWCRPRLLRGCPGRNRKASIQAFSVQRWNARKGRFMVPATAAEVRRCGCSATTVWIGLASTPETTVIVPAVSEATEPDENGYWPIRNAAKTLTRRRQAAQPRDRLTKKPAEPASSIPNRARRTVMRNLVEHRKLDPLARAAQQIVDQAAAGDPKFYLVAGWVKILEAGTVREHGGVTGARGCAVSGQRVFTHVLHASRAAPLIARWKNRLAGSGWAGVRTTICLDDP